MAQPYDRKKLVAARLAAAERQPFLAEGLYALTPVAVEGTDTFSVDDRWRLMIDPGALDRWTVIEVAGVLLHEVGHLVRDHGGRADAVGVQPSQRPHWNLAADAEINEDLIRDGVVLPEGAITPGVLGLEPGKVAEHYFRELAEKEPPEVESWDCGPGCNGSGSESAEQQRIRPAEPGLSEAEQILLRRRIALAVVAHGRRAGQEAGGWSRWAEALLDPVIDWRPLLRGAVRGAIAEVAGLVDYSYRRPSRRRVPGVILPSMIEPIPSVAVIIDTSASMDDDQLNAAWTEVQEAIKAVGVRRELVTVLMNDVDVERLSDSTASARVELTGGGGTDLRNGIDHALRLRPRPSIVIVLTDGYTPWPSAPPAARVVVALIGDVDPPPVPAWATTVTVES